MNKFRSLDLSFILFFFICLFLFIFVHIYLLINDPYFLASFYFPSSLYEGWDPRTRKEYKYKIPKEEIELYEDDRCN